MSEVAPATLAAPSIAAPATATARDPPPTRSPMLYVPSQLRRRPRHRAGGRWWMKEQEGGKEERVLSLRSRREGGVWQLEKRIKKILVDGERVGSDRKMKMRLQSLLERATMATNASFCS